jgi:thiol-disulfide isomerase/thioredoxin
MSKTILTTGLLLLLQTLSAQQISSFQNGNWRAILERKDGNQIVFNFETRDSAGKKILYIRNASERLLVDDIVTKGDSVFINLPFFESRLQAAIINKNELRGVWLKRQTDKYQEMPFSAFFDQSFRFKSPGGTLVSNISGRWAVSFTTAGQALKDSAVGEFVQNGNYLSGTFLTPTGDYRFLEGVVDGDSLRLSCFDGGHAFLFTAKIKNNNSISDGKYYSGPVSKQGWTAKRDQNAKLPDEFSLTRLRPGQSKLDFVFKDIDGNLVSLSDERFRNKVLLIQIMGSWCPNCMDETEFLSGFYREYKNKGLEIIGLAYERSTNFERSQNSLRSFQKRFGVQYPLLITGISVNDSLRTEKTLPQLENIIGFPTTIFINRNGLVEKIHTGFNGPGTGTHYEEEKKDFYRIVDSMIQ